MLQVCLRFLGGLLRRRGASASATRRRTRPPAAAQVAEHFEARLLLSSSGALVVGNDVEIDYSSLQQGSQFAQQENPSVAMSSDGSRVVLAVGDMINSGADEAVRVLEYTNNGTALTLVRDFIVESGPNLAVASYGTGPVVAINGAGTQYVVAWGGADGAVRAASIDFNGPTVVAPEDVVAPTNVSGTLTYTITPELHSIAMRGDGTFVMAWDSTMVDSNSPGTSTPEAQAQLFNIDLTAASPLIQQLNAGQNSAWAPDVAWTNHGNSSTWEAAWSGSGPPQMVGNPPTFVPGNGIWLQKYTFSAGSNTLSNQVQIVPVDQNGNYELYAQFALTDDPVGDVGFVSTVNTYSVAHIWLYTPSLATYPGFASPLTTYDPADSQYKAFATIAFDAPSGGAFQDVLVGTQRYVEGPGATWGYMQVSTGSWVYSGYIHQTIGTQDMFPDGVINAQGNWWVFARQFYVNSPYATGWKIRAWDPPVGTAEPTAGIPGPDGLLNAIDLASMHFLFAPDNGAWQFGDSSADAAQMGGSDHHHGRETRVARAP